MMGGCAKGRDRSTAGERPAAFPLGWARVRAAFSWQTSVRVGAHALVPYMTRAGGRPPCIHPMSRLLVVLALAQSVSGFLLPSPAVVSPALRAASVKAAAAPAARTRALAPQVSLRPGVRSGTCTRARFASSVRPRRCPTARVRPARVSACMTTSYVTKRVALGRRCVLT